MKAVISQRNDILTSLPFELALSIFNYLAPLDVWRLRSVSKQWNSRLSARDFEHSAVSRWKTHDDSDGVPSSSARSLEGEIRHMRAFQEGRPFSWKQHREQGRISNFKLHGHHLAYSLNSIAGDSALMVHNLCTGTVDTYRHEARRQIQDVILTSTLVAFTSALDDGLYWKRLDDPHSRMRKVQLPAVNLLLADGDGDCIVLLTRHHPSPADYTIKAVMVFDASISQLRSFEIRSSEWDLRTSLVSRQWRMIVHAMKQCVDFFCALGFDEGQGRVHHIRTGLDGSGMKENATQCPDRKMPADWSCPRPQNTGFRGRYIIAVVDQATLLRKRVLFDADQGAFMSYDDEELYSVIPTCKAGGVLWKGSVFQVAIPHYKQGEAETKSFGEITDDKGVSLHGR